MACTHHVKPFPYITTILYYYSYPTFLCTFIFFSVPDKVISFITLEVSTFYFDFSLKWKLKPLVLLYYRHLPQFAFLRFELSFYSTSFIFAEHSR